MAKDLTISQIAALQKDGNHRIGDSLYLRIKGGSRTYSFRYKEHNRERWKSLGSEKVLTLKGAKALVASFKVDIFNGRQAGGPRIESITFMAAARKALPDITARLSAGTQRHWEYTMLEIAAPHFGGKPVAAIKPEDVRALLAQFWIDSPSKAERIKVRIARILSYCKAQGWLTGDNPANKDVLRELLGAPDRTNEPHPAMTFEDVPAFFEKLKDRDEPAALALQLVILTATRAGEVLRAQRGEFKLNAEPAMWTIPAQRMKSRREHVVLLSFHALELLEHYRLGANGGRLFNIDDHAMLRLLREITGDKALTVHGFRSSFADFGINRDFPDRIVEACLAHADTNKVRAAYRRDPQLEKRMALMETWASFVLGERQISREDAEREALGLPKMDDW